MAELLQFPSDSARRAGFQRVKSTYSVREIGEQFGIGEAHIRRWARDGTVPTASLPAEGDLRFDFRALKHFRRIRELRSLGLTFRQIEAEFQGQRNLFGAAEARLIRLPLNLTPFEEAVFLHEQDDPRAEECYLRAIAEGDCVGDAFCNLGLLEFERGSVAAAFDRLTQALRFEPRHFEAHYNLATVYFEAGELRLARLHYELAARIEPHCCDTRFNLALVLTLLDNVRAAVDVLREARTLALEEALPRIDRLLSSLESSLEG